MRDLTQHLTTRADDSHAPPVFTFPKALSPFREIRDMSNPGKVLRVDRIKPHTPPLLRAPVNSFEFSLLRAYFPGGILNALATILHGLIRATPSIHRLRLGLLGYLIPFAPLAVVSQCQLWPSRVLSPLVFFLISTHFTATPGIPSTSTTLKPTSFHCFPRVRP